MEDLIEACNEALYEYNGLSKRENTFIIAIVTLTLVSRSSLLHKERLSNLTLPSKLSVDTVISPAMDGWKKSLPILKIDLTSMIRK